MNSTREEFKKKYPHLKRHLTPKPKNLPKNGTKKPSLSECYSCECYERGPDLPNVGIIHWCVSYGFDKKAKKPYTDYKNIELMKNCPKMV